MRKIVVAVALAIAGITTVAAPSSAVAAGQFCKTADEGRVTVANNGATVRCSFDGRYHRWVEIAAPTTAPPTTRPFASLTNTTTTTTTTTRPEVTVPADAQAAPVRRLYLAYFLREPDKSGLAYWSGQHRGGVSLDSISERFARSSEFVNRYGALSNGGFVDLIYTNLFGRTADAKGRTYWTGVLDRGRTRGAVMVGFSESAEFVRITTPGFHGG